MQLNLNKANKYAQIILVVLIPISILCWFVMLYYTQEIYGINSKEFKFRAGFLIPTLLSILIIWLMRSKDGESKSLLTLQEKRCIIWALADPLIILPVHRYALGADIPPLPSDIGTLEFGTSDDNVLPYQA